MKKYPLPIMLFVLWTSNANALCAKILETTEVSFFKSSDSATLNADEVYKVKGVNLDRTKFTLWFGQRLVVVERSQLRLQKTGCEKTALGQSSGATMRTPPPVEVQKDSNENSFWSDFFGGWHAGLEAAYILGTDSDTYADLLTTIPDTNDVGNLQDPIITEVKAGKGYAVRAFGERDIFFPFLRWQLGLGYRQQTFEYSAKENPSLNSVTLGSLNGYTRDITLNQVEAGTGLAYVYRLQDWSFGAGLHGDLLYNLSGEEKIDVLVPTGVILKNTAAQVKGGPPEVDFQLRAKADVRWKGLMVVAAMALDGSAHLGLGFVF